jgi:EF-P beta-lysylation protein EpmB
VIQQDTTALEARESTNAGVFVPDRVSHPPPAESRRLPASREQWQTELAAAIRDPDQLVDRLGLPDGLRAAARQSAALFPLVVPESYLARMTPGNPADPLLRQVLPVVDETNSPANFRADPLAEQQARIAPGLLQKYAGRALLITTGACAVHCRYCFRRHYPYQAEPRQLADWEPAFAALAADESLHEVLLSGGDPLTWTDARLAPLIDRLEQIPHLRRLRIHTRLPIVIPSRITPRLLQRLRTSRLTPIIVVHANHPAEIVGDCAEALRQLVLGGLTTLNQAVLLRGINDDADTLCQLCERLSNVGVLPYYLHQLDRVQGAAHFEVAEDRGRELLAELRRRLPGYAVPRYVREIPGVPYKSPLDHIGGETAPDGLPPGTGS